jgi:hypothetical protein
VDFGRVAEAVSECLAKEGHRALVAGALGLHAHGHSRLTFDLDLITVSEAQKPLLSLLESLGYETLHVSAGYSNHVHSAPAWGRLDLIYVDANTADELFKESRTTTRLGNVDFRVPKPEHLVALKVHAIKNDPRRTIQDLADIQFLLRIPGVDRAEVARHFEKAGLSEEYERLRKTL